jgi:hypothetical protein
MNPEQPIGHLDPLEDVRLERLLRRDAARDPWVEDAGFSLRVMSALPPARQLRSYSWLGPALGAVAAAGVAAFSPVTHELLAPLNNALSGHAINPSSLMALVPVAALVYFAAWFATSETR